MHPWGVEAKGRRMVDDGFMYNLWPSDLIMLHNVGEKEREDVLLFIILTGSSQKNVSLNEPCIQCNSYPPPKIGLEKGLWEGIPGNLPLPLVCISLLAPPHVPWILESLAILPPQALLCFMG